MTLGSPLPDNNSTAKKSVDNCDQCGKKESIVGNRDSGAIPNIRQKKIATRKDADHEFFYMTLLSQIMTHKKQKQLIEIQADAEKLFKECKSKGVPFFDWNDWISTHIEITLEKLSNYKMNRLNNLAKRGQTKLL